MTNQNLQMIAKTLGSFPPNQLETLGNLFINLSKLPTDESLSESDYQECMRMVNNPETTEWFSLDDIQI